MLTFADIFEALADSFGSAVAVVCGDSEMSWAEDDDKADRVDARSLFDVAFGRSVA